MGHFFITEKDFKEEGFEFVERKGLGHPDTLADALAETLSVEYSNYTLKRYGAILHHNFDKVGLLGGSSFVALGEGYMTQPIRILVNGRVSTKFGNEEIPVRKIIADWVKEFFKKRLPMINVDNDLKIHFNLSNKSSPGKTYEKESKRGTRRYWFEPRGLYDIQELKKLLSNDTSLGVGYAPYSVLEKIVLEIENTLSSDKYKFKNKWLGSDIKIMGFRYKNDYHFTICIPQIANFVKNLEDYKANIKKAEKIIFSVIRKYNITDKTELNINTRDNYKVRELYLTATGSSIESGDEGLVGRGNRINGVISPSRPLSMEGSCGKNPVYHIGKVYYIAAHNIAQKIYKNFGITNEIYLASQSGRDLLDPWIKAVAIPYGFKKKKELKKIIETEIKNIPQITKDILNKKLVLY